MAEGSVRAFRNGSAVVVLVFCGVLGFGIGCELGAWREFAARRAWLGASVGLSDERAIGFLR